MNTFKKSWLLVKETCAIIKKDTGVVGYGALTFFISLFVFAFIGLTGYLTNQIVPTGSGTVTPIGMVMIVLALFLVSIVGVFYSVATAHVVLMRLKGENPVFADGVQVAMQRRVQIIGFGIIAATVGLILRAIERLTRNLDGIPGFILSLVINATLAALWSISSFFVYPLIAEKGTDGIQSLKQSSALFNKTWGEQVIVGIGFGLFSFGLTVLALTPVFTTLFLDLGVAFGITALIVSVVLVTLVQLFFSIAQTVFQTSLYYYATTGKQPAGYSTTIVESAVISANKPA